MPHCSVIIATWNTRGLVEDALDSLFRHNPADSMEVIVVDNASTDGTAEMIREKFPRVVLLCEERNTGYAPATNRGIRMATGRHILLLGSDTVVRKDTLSVLAGYLDTHPDVSAVACRLMNPDGTPQMSCRRFPRVRDAIATYLSWHFLTGWYTMKGFDFFKTQEVEQPAATCLMVRRGELVRLQGFDEAYTVLYNDVDLCRRLRKIGGRIVYNAETEVLHHGSSTTRSAPPALRLEMYRNILRYFSRYHGTVARWLLTPVLMMRYLAATRSPAAIRLISLKSEGWPG
ncbi:MAG: glycosyltransferase family 2 protein [Bacteroidetes bacterium]|nr:glycosyltransferase family 2 protein [Bacteroidota bacterium]